MTINEAIRIANTHRKRTYDIPTLIAAHDCLLHSYSDNQRVIACQERLFTAITGKEPRRIDDD